MEMQNTRSEKFGDGHIEGHIYKKLPKGQNPATSERVMEIAEKLVNDKRRTKNFNGAPTQFNFGSGFEWRSHFSFPAPLAADI
jgi:hypothetical protein